MRVYWARVGGASAPDDGAGRILGALWPAPVNLDACFEAAGETDFGDADLAWDEAAEELTRRLVAELSRYGAPRLLSEPVLNRGPWFLRPFRKPPAVDLVEQLQLAAHWDSLPPCRVAFGGSGVAVETGAGHQIYWLSLPADAADDLESLAARIAGDAPLARKDLAWEHLRPR